MKTFIKNNCIFRDKKYYDINIKYIGMLNWSDMKYKKKNNLKFCML